MPFVDATPPDSPAPPRPATTTTTYSIPSNADLAAVAATVAVVGVLMALLIAWLVVRLRSAARSQPHTIPIATRRPTSNASYVFRPSFAPSESSSKFSFIRKPLRLSHQRQDGSWDFADPDPFHFKKECLSDPPPHLEHRPAPLTLAPAYAPRAHRASTHKDEWGPRTPTTPTSVVEPPPPAYCRESSLSSVYQHKHLSLLDRSS